MPHSPLQLFFLAFVLPTLLATTAVAADGRAEALDLIDAMGCRGCHVIGGGGGTLGPPLDKIGRRLDREELRRQLTVPRVANPASSMPSYRHLTEPQMNLLIDYLERLR